MCIAGEMNTENHGKCYLARSILHVRILLLVWGQTNLLTELGRFDNSDYRFSSKNRGYQAH